MPSSPRLGLYRIIRPSLVLSQSFTDRLWCGQNEKWWIMGRRRDQFGPEGPEVSTSAACRSLRFQKQSTLALWYRARTADSRKGTRKTMIVALARKLVIALWRFVTTGETLEGLVPRFLSCPRPPG